MDGVSQQTGILHKATGCGFGACIAAKPFAIRSVDQKTVADLGYDPNRVTLEGRAREVAQLIALGLADKEIAYHLGVSQGTVKGHVSSVLRLLGLYRRTQICRYVYESGLSWQP